MPLTAVGSHGLIVAPLLSDTEWEDLRQAVRTGTTLSCRSEDHPMLPRISKLGLRHFFHRGGVHAGAEETLDHLALKALCVQVAHAHGWRASTEYPAPDRSWVADVHTSNDERTLIVEVQWSHQTEADYEARTQRYRAAGHQVVWLERVRKNNYATIQDGDSLRLPFWKDSKLGYIDAAHDQLPLQDRLIDVFTSRLAPGPPTQYADVFPAHCYRCKGRHTQWLMPYSELWTSHDRIEADPRVLAVVRTVAPPDAPMATINLRYSKTAADDYQAFTCPHCGALQGDFYLPEHRLDAIHAGTLTRVPAIVSEGTTWDTTLLRDGWYQAQDDARGLHAPIRLAPQTPQTPPPADLPDRRRRTRPSSTRDDRRDDRPRQPSLAERVRSERTTDPAPNADRIRDFYARLARDSSTLDEQPLGAATPAESTTPGSQDRTGEQGAPSRPLT